MFGHTESHWDVCGLESYGKGFLFSRPKIVMEFVKKVIKVMDFLNTDLIIKMHKMHTCLLVHFFPYL